MLINNPPPFSPQSEIERKRRYEDAHPRQIIESEGNNKRTLAIGIGAILLVLVAIIALFYGILIGF